MNLKKVSLISLIVCVVITGFVFFSKAQFQIAPNNQNFGTINSSSKLNDTNLKPSIYTSFYPVEFLVSNIVGGIIKVQSITPKNISPHDYETTPQDIAKLEKADLFVYMGGEIDGFANKVSQNLSFKKIPSIAINDFLPLQEITGEKDQKSYDPHTWLSPKNMLIANENITKKLIELYPQQKTIFEANSNLLKTKLTALDQAYSSKLKNCKLDFIITSHDAFGYLAKDYNFKIQAVSGTDPRDQIGLKEVDSISKKILESGVNYIFTSDDEGAKTIQNLATKTGANVLELGTMETIEPNQDYFEIMQSNLQNLATARQCQ